MAAAAGEQLPRRFPIFPLRGALLLPGGTLPLNIFEPRYLSMVRDAMQTDRVIGMVQPRQDEDPAPQPAIYMVGCAGRISNYRETEDGRILITLAGLCRFEVKRELDVPTAYRQIFAEFARFREDLQPGPIPEELRPRLFGVLGSYFQRHGIEADDEAVREAPLSALVTSLAMICPFTADEKQALLEADDLVRRTELLIAMMAMDAVPPVGGSAVRH